MSTLLAMQLREIAERDLMSTRARKKLQRLADKVEVLEIDNGVVTRTLGNMLRKSIAAGPTGQESGEVVSYPPAEKTVI